MTPTDQHSGHPVVREYSKLAAVYDEKWSFYVRATIDSTLARLDVKRGERLLDVGCGTGVLLQQLAGRELRLCGVDPVPAMLAVARARLGPDADLQEAWAERLPHGDGVFDVVACCNVFHYIHQPAAALGEMRRVLRPGGRLVLTDWCDDFLACKVCDLYLRAFDPAHLRTYGRAALARLLTGANFAEVQIERYKINWLWGLMTAQARKADGSVRQP